MKILVLENSLDDLLNVKISVNGGQSYTDYEVSSLKNGGLTLDCNPSDLKVICDTNILNYIKVFADGEKLNTGSGGVSGDKLMCYAMDHQDPRGLVVYTDKPATQIYIDTTGGYGYPVLPVDEGKHLFIMSKTFGGYELKSMNLIYEDGSTSTDLKDKFVEV